MKSEWTEDLRQGLLAEFPEANIEIVATGDRVTGAEFIEDGPIFRVKVTHSSRRPVWLQLTEGLGRETGAALEYLVPRVRAMSAV